MPAIRTEREIDAPPREVWAVLTDLEFFEEWNPHVVAGSGTVAEGETIELTVDASGAPTISITPTLSVVDEPRELEWVGSVIASPIFEGRHTFELHPLEDGRTRFVNREQFGGLIPRFAISEDDTEDHEAMNDALAAEVTARSEAADEREA